MNRRDTVFASIALCASPLASFAQQQAKVWRSGFLSSFAGPVNVTEAFRDQLRILGYIEGQNHSSTAGRREQARACRKWRPSWCDSRSMSS